MWIVIWLSAVLVGAIIVSNKGKTGTGIVLSLLLSWIGVIIVAVLQPSTGLLKRKRRLKRVKCCRAGR